MTDELRRVLGVGAAEPVTLVDPQTNIAYVLLTADEYARLSSEPPIAETYPLQEAVAHAEGWDDPEMADYDDYDAHRSQRK